MKELVLNLYAYCDPFTRTVSALSATPHEIDGDDNHKLNFLEKHRSLDYLNSKKLNIPQHSVVLIDNVEYCGRIPMSYLHHDVMSVFEGVIKAIEKDVYPLKIGINPLV